MSAHFWMGEGAYDNTHENEFAAEIARHLEVLYRDKEEDVHVVFNLKLPVRNVNTKEVHYEDHDMVVLTSKKVFDLEMKCHRGKIFIDQDGEWYSDKDRIEGGCGSRTPFKQVEDHRCHMAYFLQDDIGEFYKKQHPRFNCRKYVLGVLLFPNSAKIPQPKEIPPEIGGHLWFKVIKLSDLGSLLAREASGRYTQLSSDEMLILLKNHFKVKQARLGPNGMPYIIKERKTHADKGVEKDTAQKDDGGGKEGEEKQSFTCGQDVRNGETPKDEMPQGVNSSGQNNKTNAHDAEPHSDTEEHLNASAKKPRENHEEVKGSEEIPKAANAQGLGVTPSTGSDKSATELRKNYVDYPVTQVLVSSVRVQILGAFLRCFCPEWSPISLVSKLFRQKTGIDVKAFVGYDLDTLSRDPVGGKLLEWRRAEKYPHKLEVAATGGKISEPSPRTVSCVQNVLKDKKPEDVDYVQVGKHLCLRRMRPEKVMVAHVLKKEV